MVAAFSLDAPALVSPLDVRLGGVVNPLDERRGGVCGGGARPIPEVLARVGGFGLEGSDPAKWGRYH